MNVGQPARARTAGFTLLEALVALVVISIGLLGLLGLQTVSVVSTQTSEARSLASIAADDIGERIRANPAGAAAGEYDPVNHPYDPKNDTAPKPDCLATQCSAKQMAQLDAWEWDRALYSELRGRGYVNCTKPASPSPTNPCVAYTVTVAWKERQTPGDNTTPTGGELCADKRFGDRCFITVIRP